jgi:thiol-disulfide isomerase/thioredoxin|uniref:TlpA family protein disulfide reductase n=2 Tax=Algoriphagus sp. TaxID=1872435 RepID=UPI004047CF98
MKNSILLLLLWIVCSEVQAQTLSGVFPPISGQLLTLEGTKGFDTYSIGSAKADEKGQFSLSYSPQDYGIAFLSGEDKKPFVVILEKSGVRLEGQVLSEASSIRILEGQENRWFEQYTQEQGKREQALSAWAYLQNLYQNDSFFAIQKVPNQDIGKELIRIQEEEKQFIATLPSESFVRWFLPIRKLVSSVGAVAQYRTSELPQTITAFRTMDYADPRFQKSGLYRDLFESQFWLLENSGGTLDEVYEKMERSLDAILWSVGKNAPLYNEVSAYLLELLQRRSLINAAEYLALTVLEQDEVVLQPRLARQLEAYRAMKVGVTVPDIQFTGDILLQGKPISYPSRLSEVTAPYRLVIFGASWCPACSEAMGELIPLYEKWNKLGLEAIFVSLDTDPTAFQAYSEGFPFIAFSDYKKWDTQGVSDYYVSSSPSFFLIDSSGQLLLRPQSVKQIDAWVDWKLSGGNFLFP